MKNIHILGICGTFMGGLALLAKEKGFQVTGADMNIYPPMSTQLEAHGIQLISNYQADQLTAVQPDLIVVGNAMTRGKHAVLEALLNQSLAYTSGPAWIADHILADRHVIAVAGTHGKTTTASMIAWILDYAGLKPGFLIGGIPQNFHCSARVGTGKYFVIEADEYDSAFFDKRSKFLHYKPNTLILNNLEFDHADIFADLQAIKKQFQYLMRMIPSNGLIIKNHADRHLTSVLQQSCFTPVETFGGKKADWSVKNPVNNTQTFIINDKKNNQDHALSWTLTGKHNQYNALAAIAAAHHVGVPVYVAVNALQCFKSVKRRLEWYGEKNGIFVYEDFAHHPTAIQATLTGLRQKIGQTRRIIVALECASYTMRMGVHNKKLITALDKADHVLIFKPDANPDTSTTQKCRYFSHIDKMAEYLASYATTGDHIVLMSNGPFGGLAEKLMINLHSHTGILSCAD